MIPCYGYTRVSTVKQGEGVSLEAQKDAITQYAEKNALTVTQWFEEKETAAKAGRPVFNALVKDLKAGKAQGLITHKIDRSARNFRDWALIGDLADIGIGIHFATETLDFGSRGGRLAADVQAVVAADYIRNLREETIKGLKGRLKQGLYPYKAPLGYLDQGGGKVKIPDPTRKQLIQEMFELYGSGQHSLRSLQKEMVSRGLTSRNGQPITRGSLEKLLANPFFCGVIKIQRTGDVFQGIHEPLIPVLLFERVQKVKSGRYGNKTTRCNHTYRRLFTCSLCNKCLTGEKQKGRVYYRCHTKGCAAKSWREDLLELKLQDLFAKAQVSEDHSQHITSALRNWYDTLHRPASKASNINLQLAQAETQLERLTDALIDRLIDEATFRVRKEKLMMQQQALKVQRGELANKGSDLKHLLKFFEQTNNLARLYKIANPAEKRLLVELTTLNRTADADNVNFEPSFWLGAAIDLMTVPKSYHYRATFRTLPEISREHIEHLLSSDQNPSISDLVTQLGHIFETHGGLEKISGHM